MLDRMALAGIKQFAVRLSNSRLLRGFGALGLGELFIRITRLVTAVILARSLGAAEFGMAATAIASFELVRVLGNNGLDQMILRAPDERLAATCNTAYRITLALCAVMAVVQLAVGAGLAWTTNRPELFGMSACLAGSFCFLPWGMVQSCLLRRDYRLGAISSINALQVGSDNVATAVLATMGFGAWSIVIPRMISTPLWLVAVRWTKRWQREPGKGGIPLREVASFALPILASEALLAVRFNADKFLVGALLGLEALGIYYFAFSAGYGLSLVLTSALASASLPHLLDHRISPRELLTRFDKALLGLALPISGLIVLQSLAVFYYVPLLFGAKWAAVTGIVAVLCLSAATKPWHDLAVQSLRAAGMQGCELIAASMFTAVFLGFLTLGLTYGLLAGVAMLSATTIVMQLLFVAWARHLIVRRATCAEQAPAAYATSVSAA